MAGVNPSIFAQLRKKIGAPDPVFAQVRAYQNGKPALYSKQAYEIWLKENDIKQLFTQARFELRKLRNPNAKQKLINQIQPKQQNTSLIIKFLKGEYDTKAKKSERQAKINQARQNNQPRHIISVYQEYDFRQN